MSFTTKYPKFCDELYTRPKPLFWPMPVKLADPAQTLSLKRIYEEGGFAVTNILPALALAGLVNKAGSARAYSKQHIARTCAVCRRHRSELTRSKR